MESFVATSFGFEQYLRLSHSQIKAIRQAFYNAAAFIILSLICVAILAVYYTLQVFVRPLLWAVLCGTVLYPFKNSLTDVIRGWVRRVDAEDQLLLVETVVVPFRVSNALYSILIKKMSDHWSLLKTSLFLLLAFNISSYFDFFWLPGLSISISYFLISFVDCVLEFTSFKLVSLTQFSRFTGYYSRYCLRHDCFIKTIQFPLRVQCVTLFLAFIAVVVYIVWWGSKDTRIFIFCCSLDSWLLGFH